MNCILCAVVGERSGQIEDTNNAIGESNGQMQFVWRWSQCCHLLFVACQFQHLFAQTQIPDDHFFGGANSNVSSIGFVVRYKHNVRISTGHNVEIPDGMIGQILFR